MNEHFSCNIYLIFQKQEFLSIVHYHYHKFEKYVLHNSTITVYQTYVFLGCKECEYSMNTARIQTEPDIVPNYQIEEALLYDTFPEGFEWGAATSAYQVNSKLNTVWKSEKFTLI